MSFSALIPFLILFICFAGLRLPLTYATFISLLTGTVLTQTIFHATQAVWDTALLKTLEMMVEIGLILVGAFFFLEAAKKAGLVDSLAHLVRAITPNKVVQGVLVAFPLTLLVEGSSGFGTPLLVIAPILMALEFEAKLCALLPITCFIVGIPFGALGTPTRLGFPGANPTVGVFYSLAPFVFIGPLFASVLISRKFQLKETLWILSLSLVYLVSGDPFAHHGPELAALGPAFFTFSYGLTSARILFPAQDGRKRIELKGILIYGLLLLCMWGGKQTFLDRTIPGTHIRIFNPGYVFLVFGWFIHLTHMKVHLRPLLTDTFERAKRTLLVFFCMTFLVQQLRANGALELLTGALPAPLLSHGVPFLGWLGTIFVGTSTMSNLLLSKVVDPVMFVALGSGSAIGVQLAFQSIVAMKSLLHDKLSEKELFLLIAPLSAAWILILALNLMLIAV
ncbi:MAG: L-lactate permease [Proteobacteria bacterium]|nr:L-lactate permease [Pseudomonadota bacterium]